MSHWGIYTQCFVFVFVFFSMSGKEEGLDNSDSLNFLKKPAFLCRSDIQTRTKILYYFTAYTVCAFRFPWFYYPPLRLKMGVFTSLPSWVNSHFDCSKARFRKGSNTSHVAQSGPGLHTVCEPISIGVFHVPQADSTITVSFPESRLLLCLAVVNCLSKCRILA